MWHEQEQQILDRLKAKLPPEVHIGTLTELEQVEENRQKAPAAWVIYDGYTVGPYVPPGSTQLVNQAWFVVLTAKSAKGKGDNAGARDACGALALASLQALLGMHLGGGKYLHLSEAPGPEYDAGYCYLPLAFTNAATFKGQP